MPLGGEQEAIMNKLIASIDTLRKTIDSSNKEAAIYNKILGGLTAILVLLTLIMVYKMLFP